MPQDPLIDKLVARHAELKAIVTRYQEIWGEFLQLESTIANLRGLFPDLFKDVDFGAPASPVEVKTSGLAATPLLRVPAQPKPTLATLAQDILQSQEKLHASELLALLHEKGWLGSGNVQKDIRNIASTLGLKRDIFKNYGNNTWGLQSRFEEGEMKN
jgi:hypothetical protein